MRKAKDRMISLQTEMRAQAQIMRDAKAVYDKAKKTFERMSRHYATAEAEDQTP